MNKTFKLKLTAADVLAIREAVDLGHLPELSDGFYERISELASGVEFALLIDECLEDAGCGCGGGCDGGLLA
jgi:hypothetical protein